MLTASCSLSQSPSAYGHTPARMPGRHRTHEHVEHPIGVPLDRDVVVIGQQRLQVRAAAVERSVWHLVDDVDERVAGPSDPPPVAVTGWLWRRAQRLGTVAADGGAGWPSNKPGSLVSVSYGMANETSPSVSSTTEVTAEWRLSSMGPGRAARSRTSVT